MDDGFDAWLVWGDRIDLTFEEFKRVALSGSYLPSTNCPYHGERLGDRCKECHDAKMARQKLIEVKES